MNSQKTSPAAWCYLAGIRTPGTDRMIDLIRSCDYIGSAGVMSDKRSAVDFKLWSGGFITAYPLDEDREYGYFPEDEADSSGLDTTGRFLCLRKNPVPVPRSEEQCRHEKLFTDNAFLFLANYKRILSDSRMFLAPAYIRNGLAYSGYLPTATVGGYIELWLNCPSSVIFGEDDRMSSG